jgi:glucosamine--fructose-6-phosphate aminotransferase (isomerizing)
MCGIVAIVQRPARRSAPDAKDLLALLDEARAVLEHDAADLASSVHRAAVAVEKVDRMLRGAAGVRALVGHSSVLSLVAAGIDAVDDRAVQHEQRVDSGAVRFDAHQLETFNAALTRLKDAVWAVRPDRLRTAREVSALAGPHAAPATVDACTAIQLALSAIDRLEVRGRDSAGVHLLVEGHGLDLARESLGARVDDRLFTSTAVRTPDGRLSIVYKAAAEIGELGDNTRALRDAIVGDELLHRALAAPTALVTVLSHTRWASVGIISEANAHPLNSDEDGYDGPYVVAALNGDVDNYAELRDASELHIPPEVTTDAKVIPALVSRAIAGGAKPEEAFRTTVAGFAGSVAIGACVADTPGRVYLALRGSGQALYVGLAEDAFLVASEPYGLVEEASRYLRMDGESPMGRSGENGQVVVLDRDGAGTIEGIRRFAYDGTELPVREDDLTTAQITTRDIDRGDNPHYFLKEITESPRSMRKTLRGKLVERDGRTAVDLGDEALPALVRERLAEGRVRRIIAIGQGTAAVAGQAVANAITEALRGAPIRVEWTQATELSGFGLVDEMDDTLVVAISQSGTSTDTNRTVDLVRARGAAVISIVNRRSSDLCDKSDGVLFTSDGRDVEMSVASTKAFYAQIAAGFLLAAAIGDVTGHGDAAASARLLDGLRALPDAMERVLTPREPIGEAAAAYAPSRVYWAVVGNGANRIAANEIRIKLSELAYKSIGVDATEDKKHIDLSAEPLVLVCAAGLDGATADDVGKEVAIFRAHKAAPIVIATEGEDRFGDALAVLHVPAVHPSLAFVLSAMVGHLFGYEAARAIDAHARPLREARGAIETVVERGQHDLLERLAIEIAAPAARFTDGLRAGHYDGNLDARTAVRIVSLLRYAQGHAVLDAYELEHGKRGTPSTVLEDLTDALTRGIEQLTRPIDAIKHQAKTVTVGTSRSEESLFESPLVAAVLDAGAPRDRVSYRSLRILAALEPAVARVTGYTRYEIEGDPASGHARATVIDKGGSAAQLRSRTEDHPVLQGTKNLAARQQVVTVTRGRSDGRTVVIVPEMKGNETTGLTLLQVDFEGVLDAATARAVLEGYQSRMAALSDAVLETEPAFRDEVLGEIPIVDLLTEPVHVLADRWRRTPAAD